MAKPDGRIEKGQRLASAISARAWNRAQDAADIVLGVRPGVTAGDRVTLPGSLVVPCTVMTTVSGVMPGHVVQITGSDGRYPNLLAETPDTFAPSFVCLQGQVYRPRTFIQGFRTAYEIPVGVIVGGVTMPSPGSPQTVSLCVSGVCVARIKARANPFYQPKFVQPALIRTPSDNIENLAGTFEAVDTGTHRLLSVAYSTRLVVDDEVVDGGATYTTQVTWGVVVL